MAQRMSVAVLRSATFLGKSQCNRSLEPKVELLSNRVAVFWTEYSSTGEILLGKALFDTNSTSAVVRTAAPSRLIPKAFAVAIDGRAADSAIT
jgi:hypothetical protein